MKPMLRRLALFLSLFMLLAGCSGLHACLHADETDQRQAERDALSEKLAAERPTAFPAVSEPALVVTVLDVGQGDCILLVSPSGRTMLVDAGPSGSFDRIDAALKRFGVTQLDVVVATHPHEDHIGSMAAVLDAYPVGAFYTIADEQPTGWYAAMLAALGRNGCPVYPAEADTTIPWDERCTVTVLGPIAYEDDPVELNDRSVVLHVRYGDTSVLLTGDAEETEENRMLDKFPGWMFRANVLKLGHHGSASSTCHSFFSAVDPDFAVASCGANNDYGHPHFETLSLLYGHHTAFYRTDLDGSITFRLDGTNVSVDPLRKEIP
jgi:beta-lactamase superfamily II metal-dependent hydrolase